MRDRMEADVNLKREFLNKILQGDSRILLREIPEESVDVIITSPPYYKQRRYCESEYEIGKEETVEKYIDNLLKVFHECVRITKKAGNIVFNLGDKYKSGGLLMIPYKFALEALKGEPIKLIHNIIWVKLNPTPRQFNRRLVNSTEPFLHFVKSGDYYFDRKAFMETSVKKQRNKTSDKLGTQYFKDIERADLSENEKRKAKEELQSVIQEVKDGKLSSFRMKIRGMHAPAFGGQEGGRKGQLEKQGFTIIKIPGDSMKRDVMESHVETIKGCKHPSVYPESLIEELIKLLSPRNGIVLDPFVGSGTTLVAAKKLRRSFMGIDLSSRYCEYAMRRIKATVLQDRISDNDKTTFK